MCLPYYSVIPFLGIRPKEMKTFVSQNTCTVMVIEALSTILNIHSIYWKQSKCSLMGDQIVLYSHDGILLGNKNFKN